LTLVSPTLAISGKLASFTGPSAFRGDYSEVIDWGDATVSNGLTVVGSSATAFDITGSHTYQHSGTFALTITVQDAGGTSASGTGTITVGPLSSQRGWWSQPAGPLTVAPAHGPWYLNGVAPSPASPTATHSAPGPTSNQFSSSPSGSPLPATTQANVSRALGSLVQQIASDLRAILS
jgi:hypothetical protein